MTRLPYFVVLLSLFCLLLGGSVPLTAQDSLAISGDGEVVVPERLTTPVSPESYQARGNDFYRQRDLGRAILAYERGLRLDPGNKALKNNLDYVRREADITELQVREFFLSRWWRDAGAMVGVANAQWLALACWIIAVLAATLWYLRRRQMEEGKRFAILPLAVLFALFAFLFFRLGSSRLAYLERNDEAILVEDYVSLRVAPGPDASLEEELGAGRKMRIVDEFDGYFKVILASGGQGWVPVAAVERI